MDEENVIIFFQAHYGNKWSKISKHIPGIVYETRPSLLPSLDPETDLHIDSTKFQISGRTPDQVKSRHASIRRRGTAATVPAGFNAQQVEANLIAQFQHIQLAQRLVQQPTSAQVPQQKRKSAPEERGSDLFDSHTQKMLNTRHSLSPGNYPPPFASSHTASAAAASAARRRTNSSGGNSPRRESSMQIDMLDMDDERLSDMLNGLSVSQELAPAVPLSRPGTGEQTPAMNSLPSMRPTDGLIGGPAPDWRNSSRADLSFAHQDSFSFLDKVGHHVSQGSYSSGGSAGSNSSSSISFSLSSDRLSSDRESSGRGSSWMSVDPEREQKRKEAEDWYAKKLEDKQQREAPSWMSVDPEKEKDRKSVV